MKILAAISAICGLFSLAALQPSIPDRPGIPFYDFRWASDNDEWMVVKVVGSDRPVTEGDKTPLAVGVIKVRNVNVVSAGFYLTVKDFDQKLSEKQLAKEQDLDREFRLYSISMLPEKYRTPGKRVFLSTLPDPTFVKPYLVSTERVIGAQDYNQKSSR